MDNMKLNLTPITVKVDVDSAELQRNLNKMGKDIPFAMALALNELANGARDRVKSELPKKFTIRNTWTVMGIRTKRAEKRDYPNVHSLVGSVDKYMEVHDEGGDKQKGQKAFSFPYAVRKNYRSLVKRNKWPGPLLGGEGNKLPDKPIGRPRGSRNGVRQKGNKPFILKWGRFVGVFQRTRGKIETTKYKYKGGKRQKYRLLWRLYGKKVKLDKREWLFRPVREHVEEFYNEAFYNAMYKIMSSTWTQRG